jgi:acyl carrier protein
VIVKKATPSRSEVAARTLSWVRENFLYTRPDWTLKEDDPLIGNGVIDSVGVLELIEFLQREFDVTMDEDEMTERNLGSLSAIAQFVRAKYGSNGDGRGPA